MSCSQSNAVEEVRLTTFTLIHMPDPILEVIDYMLKRFASLISANLVAQMLVPCLHAMDQGRQAG
jgi:hypothetical protein